jgi:outer membrane protein assembly factor BamB
MRTPFLLLFLGFSAMGQTPIATAHTANSRPGAVTTEPILTPANILAGFGKRATLALDGKVYTQVLYVPSLRIRGKTRNVIFAGSANNTMYAWDADSYTQLWATNTGDAACSTSCAGFNWGLNYNQPVGIFSTPAIDVANHWIFFTTYNNVPIWQLYKMNLFTGAVISHVALTARVLSSSASDAVAGTLTFNPAHATQRAGLTLANGNVYAMFSSTRDVSPWHGWIMAHSEADLSAVASFCTNRNHDGGGIWMSGSGASTDSSGNLYVVTGNGSPNDTSYDGVTEFSMSILKLSSSLTLLDWFTPSDYATQNANDTDLGSSHPMLIPNPASPGNYLIVTGGKDYKVYSVQSQCMGHLGGKVGGCPGAQVFQTGIDSGQHLGIYCNAHMNGISYFSTTAGFLYAFQLLNTGLYNTRPVTGGTTAFPGAMITGSTHGAYNPIIWALTADTSALTGPATGKLRALNASTLSEIWNSGTSPVDSIGHIAKFISPTVANGKIYVPTHDGTVVVFSVVNRFSVSN